MKGKLAPAHTDPRDTYLVTMARIRKPPQTTRAIRQSIMMAMVPPERMPLPPRRPKNTGNMWQVASIFFCVRFRDESVPNRVSIETRGTEYALRSQTLTTKTIAPAVGQGQSAIRYDPNGGDGDAFKKVGDSGTTATTAEAGVFLRKGHTFAGWNTKADGTGTAYQAGAGIAYPAEGQTLTLYAQWEANAYKTVSYTHLTLPTIA